MIRLDPEEEAILVAKRSMLRFLCNWVWPLMILASFMWDITHLESNTEWWHWALEPVWYVWGIWWWRRDVRELREVRQKLREAHGEA